MALRLIPFGFAVIPMLTAILALAPVPAAAQSQSDDTPANDDAAGSDGKAAAAAADGAQSGASADTVVSVVDETPVTLGELIAIRQTLPEQYQQLPDEVLMSALLQQVTDQQLLANAALAEGLDARKVYIMALRNQQRAVLADLYMAEEVIRRLDEAAVEKAYKERILDKPSVTEVRAAHILVEDEALAAEIKAKLDNGADFAAMAAEFGTDGTAQRGGDLGFFVREQMVPQFSDAAFAMEPGQVSAPVKSPFGWHIIKLQERRDRPKPKLSDIRETLIAELTEETTKAILKDLRDAAQITRAADAVPDGAIRQDNLILD